MKNKSLFSVLVQDHPRVMERITALFGRRGYNIHSITVGSCEIPGKSRMTIVTELENQKVRQIEMQLNKMVDVLNVEEISSQPYTIQELAFVKVAKTVSANSNQSFPSSDHVSVIASDQQHVLYRIIDTPENINLRIQQMDPQQILRVIRTGAVATS
ncbi:acetolactate synthase small subunit [Evansella sp. AB-P1]|uniref:acetolactate synthase small subunit n=1 Tax=Evansella sp. AB-P1 TaxID=3037653 RepID=UPI00241D4AB5|nr:acetolactate synthase small subunit [Evansella sp. AB-P1]MDG5790158.1 acetolactate synthase small subunit [Evansella sp. AB-P1]